MVEEVRIKQILITNASKLIAITIAEICMDLQPLEKSAASSNLATQHAIQLAKEVDPKTVRTSSLVTKIHVTHHCANCY